MLLVGQLTLTEWGHSTVNETESEPRAHSVSISCQYATWCMLYAIVGSTPDSQTRLIDVGVTCGRVREKGTHSVMVLC